MRTVIFLIIAAMLSVAVLWALPTYKPEKETIESDQFPEETVDKNIRDVTPENALPGPEIKQQTVSRLPAKSLPPQPKPPSIPIILSNVRIPAAGVIIKNKLRIELEGIKPTNLDKICVTQIQGKWPCGRFARTAMRRFIRARKLECSNIAKIQKTIETHAIRAHCKIGGRDIANWLVSQGWALPDGEQFSKLHERAKAENRGFWRLTPP